MLPNANACRCCATVTTRSSSGRPSGPSDGQRDLADAVPHGRRTSVTVVSVTRQCRSRVMVDDAGSGPTMVSGAVSRMSALEAPSRSSIVAGLDDPASGPGR